MDSNQNNQFHIFSPSSIEEITAGIRVLNSAFGFSPDLPIETQKKLWTDYQQEKIVEFKFARINEQIIGTCGLLPYENLGWIGFMSIDKNFRNQHFGNKLFREILSFSESYNFKTLRGDSSELGRRVYKNFDFHEEYPVGMYFLKKQVKSLDDVNNQPQQSFNLPNWLLEKDDIIFGANRRQLLTYLFKHGTLLIKDKGNYAFIKGDIVGPIIAENWENAVNLVSKSQEFGAQKIYIPHHPDLSQDFLFHIGITEGQGSMCIRLIHGEPIQEMNQFIYAAHSFSTG